MRTGWKPVSRSRLSKARPKPSRPSQSEAPGGIASRKRNLDLKNRADMPPDAKALGGRELRSPLFPPFFRVKPK
jgi:hypothetical protein